MEKLLALGVVISAIDKVSKPAQAIKERFGELQKQLSSINTQAAQNEIAKLQAKIASMQNFRLKLKAKLDIEDARVKSASQALKNIERELNALQKAKLSLDKKFKKGTLSAKEYEQELGKIAAKTQILSRKKLGLQKELQKAKNSAASLQNQLSRVDSVIAKLENKKLSLDENIQKAAVAAKALNGRLREIGSSLAAASTKLYAFGTAVSAPMKSMINSYQEIQQAQGDIASLGIDAKGIESITKAAKQMSNQFAGISAPEFIKASYDIKSGIASLSAQGVAEFTKFAAMTAQATKSSVAEMTKLFALGYGIFKRDDESDIDFGKRFSASIAKAVQAFRTDGSDLVQGISNIGATAKAMGVSLAQELAIIGKAKDAFSSAAEAGTAYRAFLAGAVGAQKELGLVFTDSFGKLLPMAKILERIKQKFGDLDAIEMAKLKKAFGSEEAIKIITALIDKTDELKKAKEALAKASIEDVKEMALARNRGKEFALLQQRLSNLAATFGKFLAPAVSFASEKIGAFAAWLDKIAASNSFVKYLFYFVSGLGALGFTLGAAGIALSAFAVGLSFIGGALKIKVALLQGAAMAQKGFAAATKIATAAQRVFNFVISQNPLARFIRIAMLVGAAAVYMYNHFAWFRDGVNAVFSFVKSVVIGTAQAIKAVWQRVANFFHSLWSGIKSIFSSGTSFIKKALSFSPIGLVFGAFAPVSKFFGSFWSGVAGMFKKGVGYIANLFLHPVQTIKKNFAALFEWLGKKFGWVGSVVKKVFGFGAKIGSAIKGFFGGNEEEKPKVGAAIKKAVAVGASATTLAIAQPQLPKVPKFDVKPIEINTTVPKPVVKSHIQKIPAIEPNLHQAQKIVTPKIRPLIEPQVAKKVTVINPAITPIVTHPKPIIPQIVTPKPVVVAPKILEPKPIAPAVHHPKPIIPRIVQPEPVTPIVHQPKPVWPKVLEPSPIIPKVQQLKPIAPQIIPPKPIAPQVLQPKPIIPTVATLPAIELKIVQPKPIAPLLAKMPVLEPVVKNPQPIIPRVQNIATIEPKPIVPKVLEPKPIIPQIANLKPIIPKIITPKPIAPQIQIPKAIMPNIAPKILEPKPIIPKVIEPKPILAKMRPLSMPTPLLSQSVCQCQSLQKCRKKR